MSTNKKHFIRSLFDFLEGRQYLWLKAVSQTPFDLVGPTDIDLLVQESDLESLYQFVQGTPTVVACQRSAENGATYLRLFFSDGESLKLDLLTQLVRKQWTYLSVEYLFKNGIQRNGIATYRPENLLEHVLFFNFLNNSGLPEKYLEYFHGEPPAEQQRLLQFLEHKYGLGFSSFAAMSAYDPAVKRGMVNYLQKQPENSLPSRIWTGACFYAKKILRLLRAKNEVITFSGVDGAGKTTLLNDLKTVLTSHQAKKVVVLRHRPSVLPILSAWKIGKEAAEAKATSSLPRQGRNQNRLGSLLRFSYYFADYFLGQFYVWARYLLPGYTVIYDRYYFDFIVDGKRSNIVIGEGLPRWLYRFVAKPGLNVFLYADPALIRLRKQELPAADIAYMTERYLALFGDLATHCRGQYLCIENNDRADSLKTILNYYSKTF